MLYEIEGKAGIIGQVSKAEETKSGSTLFVASTDDEDRHGDIVRQDWKLAEYRSNPVILWMHDHMQAPIGRAKSARTVTGEDGRSRLMIDVEWDASGVNPLAETIAAQFANGYLSTGSVGFVPNKRTFRNQLSEDHAAYKPLGKGESQWMHGMYLEQNNLLEFSATTIPANPNARAVRAWAQEADEPTAQVSRLLSESGVRSELRSLMLEWLRQDPEMLQAVRAAYLSAPEPKPTRNVLNFDTLADALNIK